MLREEEQREEVQERIARQQRLRRQRMVWGFSSQACTLAVVLGLALFGMVPWAVTIAYLLVMLLINGSLYALLRSNINLRFPDPSMTTAQIVLPVAPAPMVMYFVSDTQARTAFLLLATGGLLFGAFALSRRYMQGLGLLIALSYLLLLFVLQWTAPERVYWPTEVIILFAYAAVLVTVANLGSYIATLRLKLREKNRELERLAGEDQLTRLPNRRSLMHQLQRESARLERRSTTRDSLCISILDVDHFKRINDRWGHDAGDAVLRSIGDLLRDSMRQGDFVGRFGGEEFVLLLPDTSLEDAEQVTSRLQARVAELICPDLPPGEHISISQGLAMHRPGGDITETLKRADQALYRAKEAGRSQLVIADELSDPGAAPA